MAKIEESVDELLAKHSNLSKEEALKIVTDKIARKKKKKAAKADKVSAQKVRNEANRPEGK